MIYAETNCFTISIYVDELYLDVLYD